MALAKKIAAFVIVVLSLTPTVYFFFQDNRPWAGIWFGVVLLALIIYTIGRERGLAAYVFTVACLAFLGFSAANLGEEVHSLPLDTTRAIEGLVILAFIVGSVVFLASDFIFATRDGSRWRSFLYLLYWILGLSGTYREVKDGKISEVKPRLPALKANATELITVHPDHAVVLQRDGSFSRVAGPGQVWTKPGESIKAVIRTSGQSVKDKVAGVLTKDEIPVTVHFSVAFQIAPDPAKKVELGKPYPVSKEALLKAAYNVGNIERAMKGVAGSLLSDKIAQSALDDIYDPLHPDTFPLGEIRTQLKEQLTKIAEKWGYVVHSFTIDRVEIPEEVSKQMLERWQAAWTRNEEVEKEHTRKKAAAIRAERQKIEMEARLARAEAEARADRIREMEKIRTKEEVLNRYLTLLERHVGKVDMHTAAQLLQILLIGEEPARYLPYLRLQPSATTGFTREDLAREVAKGVGLGFLGSPAESQPLIQSGSPPHWPEEKRPASEQDEQEEEYD